ncbi:hypothetical protein [Acinetobacter sp. HY1485]|uniref:hypothetical protein n=1 Tax=Acinetobacter sp. HY1485 TaxID=2970918 RepID=UPI0022B957F6|nr:hypothetical protein [Acinetobacter sp. HY1485]
MKIIFIHGINQQKYNAQTFQDHWSKVFDIGVKQNQLDSQHISLEFPFYGDILHHFAHKQKTFKQHLLDAPIPLLPHYNKQNKSSLIKKLVGISQFTKDHLLKEMISLLNHFPNFHESLVQKFLFETYLYWHDATFQQQIYHRIASCFDENEEHIVIAHSLGSVVAYDLLQQLPHQYKVKRFITLASPLPFNVVQKHIVQPIQRPAVLQGDWYNFFSSDDYLTTKAMLPPLFNLQPAIINKKIHTFLDKPHEIIGYLQHPSVIRCILLKNQT